MADDKAKKIQDSELEAVNGGCGGSEPEPVCPSCGSREYSVVTSYNVNGTAERLYRCSKCNTTYELDE